ncbi:hypothetical protein [Bradyrhizobium sp. BR 1433]|uniref:hypothetical protein n=1 Tax=Bradyrhizobium sp. BR 1433 TaxID=3447967 RepID=UPI003EE44780
MMMLQQQTFHERGRAPTRRLYLGADHESNPARNQRDLVSGKTEQALDQDELRKFTDNQCDATTTKSLCQSALV